MNHKTLKNDKDLFTPSEIEGDNEKGQRTNKKIKENIRFLFQSELTLRISWLVKQSQM